MELNQLYRAFCASDGIETDSRKPLENKLFFAFKGQHFDGNAFAEKAVNAGARLAIVESDQYATCDKIIVVDNVLRTLQQLATMHRQTLDIPVIGITGSNGKTTTKELAHLVLSTTYHVNTTVGNFNNLLGLPLTILKADETHDMMLLEMGSNALGEIEQLCAIALPDFGLITNIGNAHLEGFGGLEGVSHEKQALFRAVQARDGKIFVNKSDHYISACATRYSSSISYALGAPVQEESLVQLAVQQEIPTVILEIPASSDNVVCQTHLMGLHNAMNCAAAAAIGFEFKIPADDIAKALSTYVPANNRSQLLSSGTTRVLLDAYNANPDSMKQALLVLDKWQAKKKIAILGDMKELGEGSLAAHRHLISEVERLGIDAYYFIGSEMQAITDEAFADVHDFGQRLSEEDITDAVILIKGSRSIGLERILEYLPVDFK